MKVIVEAGSTKTDSVLLNNQGEVIKRHASPGINPLSDKDYLDAIKHLSKHFLNLPIEALHYYGSGCINKVVNEQVKNNLRSSLGGHFPISVSDDLIAVGRGMCQKDPGIVGILGTGSNMGYYNGTSIVDGIQSCGYLIGDEGSGFQIGKSIYRKLARKELTRDVEDKLRKRYDLSNKDLIAYLYQHPNPRAFLASISRGYQDLDADDQSHITNEVFNHFIRNMIMPMYKKYQQPIYLVGSIATYFAPELRQMFQKINIIAANFAKSPLEGLIRYHRYE